MTKADVLMTTPMTPYVIAGLERAFNLRKLWEAPDPEAAIASLAPSLTLMAAGVGHAPVTGAFMDRFPKLEIISSMGVGYDHIDAAYAGAHGIVVTHTPGVLDEEVADTAMALLLNTVRRLPQAERYLRAGGWLTRPFPLTATLHGRTMGILGLGRIGQAIAARAQAFGLKVAYHNRHPKPDQPFAYFPTLIGLAQACDILMVAAPGGESTRRIVDAAVLAALGPDGVLINIGRGSVVDDDALIDALAHGRILAAGLDVFTDEPRVPQALLDFDNVVLLPHVASATHFTRDAMGQLVIDNLVAWSEGRGALTPVPETATMTASGRAGCA